MTPRITIPSRCTITIDGIEYDALIVGGEILSDRTVDIAWKRDLATRGGLNPARTRRSVNLFIQDKDDQ